MRTTHAPLALLALLLTAAGCTADAPRPVAAATSKRARPPFVLGAVTGPSQFAGVVEERLPAGGYLYLRVARDGGEGVWVASLQKPLAVGDRVSVRALATRSPFPSARLDRVFPSVTFGVVSLDDAGAPSPSRKES